jgi:hypothetical protein
MKLKVFLLQSLRGRGRSRTAGRWSSGYGDVGLGCAGSGGRDGAITSGRCRSLVRSFSASIASIFSFLLILDGVRAFSVLSVVLLLQLADVPDEDLGVGIVHIAVGQLLVSPDKL